MAPRKRSKNISGLRNQGRKHQEEPTSNQVAIQEETESAGSDHDTAPAQSQNSHGRRAFFRAIFGVDCGDDELENMDIDMNDLDDSESDSDLDLDDGNYDPDPDLESAEMQGRLFQWAKEHDDDPRDEDWVPPWLKPPPPRRKVSTFFTRILEF